MSIYDNYDLHVFLNLKIRKFNVIINLPNQLNQIVIFLKCIFLFKICVYIFCDVIFCHHAR